MKELGIEPAGSPSEAPLPNGGIKDKPQFRREGSAMIDTAYPHVADRLFGRAHAIEPNAFRALIESPAGRRIIAGERTETSAKDLRALDASGLT